MKIEQIAYDVRSRYFCIKKIVRQQSHNGKNKTFWFFDWEGLKQRQDQFARTGVPTPAMWSGDLSNITDSSGDVFTLYDPLTTKADGTRLPFSGNIIPSDRISPFAKLMQTLV